MHVIATTGAVKPQAILLVIDSLSISQLCCNAVQLHVFAFGCRLNWQLHFGEPPKWGSGVKFILADVAPGQRDSDKAALTLTGDAGAIAAQLSEALDSATGFDPAHYQDWTQQLTEKVC